MHFVNATASSPRRISNPRIPGTSRCICGTGSRLSVRSRSVRHRLWCRCCDGLDADCDPRLHVRNVFTRMAVRPKAFWETQRLTARPAASGDARVMFENYARDPAVAKYMTWRPHQTVDDTLAFL